MVKKVGNLDMVTLLKNVTPWRRTKNNSGDYNASESQGKVGSELKLLSDYLVGFNRKNSYL